MADYYPLIARAIAGLEKNTGDARRALYERARTALVAQLRGVTPALSENDVTRERLALEESIRKVEAEAARKAWVDPATAAAATPARIRAPEFPRWDPPAPTAGIDYDDPSPRRTPSSPRSDALATRTQRPLGNGHAAAAAATSLRGEQRYVDPVFDQPLSSDPSGSPRGAQARAGNGQRRSLLDSGVNDFRSVVAENEDDDVSARNGRHARDNFTTTAPAVIEPHYDAPAVAEGEPALIPDYQAPPTMLEGGHDYEEPRTLQPMPQPVRDLEREVTPGRSWRDKIKLAAILVLLAGFGSVVAWQWSNMTMLFGALRGPSTAEAPREVSPPQKRSTKIPDRFEPGASGAAAQAPALANVQPQAPATASGAAVAQKVVLYEEDPSDPQGKRYVGSAVWRTEKVPAGAGQPPEIAIRADVEIPERKLAMTWSLRRNTDQSLPASHTVEIMFRLPQDFSAGSISNVPGILMKASEQTRGVPLAGLAVKVTNGFFLIGLSSADADRERNLKMLKDRQWFDIPVVYENNRRAILAVEKGTPGERAFAEAFAAWRQ
jgi:hypothetical protein